MCESIRIFVIYLWIFTIVSIIYISYTRIREGIDTEPTGNEHDPLYISTINSANIQVLKDEIKELSKLRSSVDSLSQRVDANTQQITSLVMAPSID